MRLLLAVVAIMAGLYLVLVLAVWHLQERVVWQPPRLAAAPEGHARRIEYTADDGQSLLAYLVGEPAHATGLLIAWHGNADLAAWLVPWAAEVERRTGWAVLVPEYRGYGGLTGTPDYVSSQRDARAAYRVARDHLGVEASQIGFFGHSLGSAIATELAAEHPGRVLVLQAPFTSAHDMARASLLRPVSAVWSRIGRVHFDTRAKVATLDVPVWVVHGERDTVIPVQMGQAVHAAARVRGGFLIVPGAGHNDVEQVAGEAYWTWLQRALGAKASGPSFQ